MSDFAITKVRLLDHALGRVLLHRAELGSGGVLRLQQGRDMPIHGVERLLTQGHTVVVATLISPDVYVRGDAVWRRARGGGLRSVRFAEHESVALEDLPQYSSCRIDRFGPKLSADNLETFGPRRQGLC